uniref:Uncharacterized protein n=1 Tax=Brassica campestris TaxID=3711 RepID=M4E023_BRACM
MAGLPLPLGSESQKIHERFCVIFEECIENNMSKAEILSYVHDKYLIPLHDTNREDFCQQVLNALGHIIKLLSDGHGLGPHPSATGSLKRKRVGENEERGENERGGNEEAEKPQEKEEGNGEELQKEEEGENEGLQKNERADTKTERGTLFVMTQLASSSPKPIYVKRKRVGENEERGKNEEGEKLQENERGGNEEAEKQKEKEESVNEGLQKKEEGNGEELQKKEEGEN